MPNIDDIVNKNYTQESKAMLKSKIKELAEIAAKDQVKTYEYLEELFSFISGLRHKLADNFECSPTDLSFANPEEGISSAQGYPEKSTIVRDDGFFEFWLVINLRVDPFNMNTCSHSFIEKGLIPPTGVVLIMAVKPDKNLFIIKTNRNQEKTFEIDPNNDSSWINLFEYCFESTKAIFEGGLERRISELGTLKDNAPKGNFGYNIE
jgi:hypothetical protein